MIALRECQKLEDKVIHGYTIVEVMERTGLSRCAILLRKGFKDIDCFSLPNKSGKGRSYKVYDIQQVCDLFHLAYPTAEEIVKADRQPSKRNDKGLPRYPKGASLKLRKALDEELIELAKSFYMESQKKNLKGACNKAVNYYLDISSNPLPEGVANKGKFKIYLHQQRLNRKDVHYESPYWSDDWKGLHDRANNKRSSKRMEHTNRWKLLKLFFNTGLIKQGFGAGQLWFIDGTQLDVWVKVKDDEGKIKEVRPYWMVIRCAITRKLIASSIVRSENTSEVCQLLAKAYRLTGVPKYGIIPDNGAVFKGMSFKHFFKSFYSNESIDWIKDSYIQDIFPWQKHTPLIFPPPEIPTFPGKASGEREFLEDMKRLAEMPETSKSWQSDMNNKTGMHIGNSVVPLLKAANPIEDVLKAFSDEIRVKEADDMRWGSFPGFVDIAKEAGLDEIQSLPTIDNVFNFFGGFDGDNFMKIPEENEAIIMFYSCVFDSNYMHRNVKCSGNGHVTISHNKEQYNYGSEEAMGRRASGRSITVLPDLLNPRIAHIFAEKQFNKTWQIFEDKEPVIYLGSADDHTIETIEDLKKIREAGQIRKAIELERDEEIAKVKKLDFTAHRKFVLENHDFKQFENAKPELKIANLNQEKALTQNTDIHINDEKDNHKVAKKVDVVKEEVVIYEDEDDYKDSLAKEFIRARANNIKEKQYKVS